MNKAVLIAVISSFSFSLSAYADEIPQCSNKGALARVARAKLRVSPAKYPFAVMSDMAYNDQRKINLRGIAKNGSNAPAISTWVKCYK